MNVLPGTIIQINTHGNLSLVKVQVVDLVFTSIIIETPTTVDYLKPGTSIKVMFKETEVIIGKDTPNISLQNKIRATISQIDQGALLCRLTLKYHDHTITSVITSNAVEQLQLSEGTEVVAMVKTNEVMLSE